MQILTVNSTAIFQMHNSSIEKHLDPASQNAFAQNEETTTKTDRINPDTVDPKPRNSERLFLDPSNPEFRELQLLKQIDREVRQHEQAHLSAAGQFSQGGASFSFQKGSDGRNYAVSGEVKIDTAPVANDPEATIQKMKVVQSAAMAPANPSAQDRAVAAQAAQTATQARSELQQEAQEKRVEQSSAPESSRQNRVNEAYQISTDSDSANQIIDLLV